MCVCPQVFMAMSVAGIVFDGYFFAFHLLNIVNNNQLLRGVIQAVTQNGLTTLLASTHDSQCRIDRDLLLQIHRPIQTDTYILILTLLRLESQIT